MTSGGGKIAGPALIVVGLLMLLGQMGMPAFGILWPLILLAVGLGMILRYRQGGEDSGLVFSGSLLIMLTIIFLAAQADAIDLGRHWPAFPAAVGIAFLIMARVDEKRRDAMVPGWICLGAALVLYFFSLGFFVATIKWLLGLIGMLLKVIIPLGLIGFGGWMLFHERQESAAESGPDIPEKVSPQGPPPEDADLDEAEEAEAEHTAPGAGLASAEKEVPPAPIEDAEFEDEDQDEDQDEDEDQDQDEGQGEAWRPESGDDPGEDEPEEGESEEDSRGEDDPRRDPGSSY